MRYNVILHVDSSVLRIINADSEDEALSKAYNESTITEAERGEIIDGLQFGEVISIEKAEG